MSTMASPITSLTVVYPTVYSCVDQRKYQSSASLAYMRGNSSVTSEFPAEMESNSDNVSIWWRHRDIWRDDISTLATQHKFRVFHNCNYLFLALKFWVFNLCLRGHQCLMSAEMWFARHRPLCEESLIKCKYFEENSCEISQVRVYLFHDFRMTFYMTWSYFI